jgi:division protein CdvB (Snf7/Vps24/ESCRT-III family)
MLNNQEAFDQLSAAYDEFDEVTLNAVASGANLEQLDWINQIKQIMLEEMDRLANAILEDAVSGYQAQVASFKAVLDDLGDFKDELNEIAEDVAKVEKILDRFGKLANVVAAIT